MLLVSPGTPKPPGLGGPGYGCPGGYPDIESLAPDDTVAQGAVRVDVDQLNAVGQHVASGW